MAIIAGVGATEFAWSYGVSELSDVLMSSI